MISDFRNGDEFAALMVSLARIESVNYVAFEAAQASERKPQDIHDQRRIELENKLLSRQLRSALICSAYSLAEAAIIGLTPKREALPANIRKAFGLSNGSRIPKLLRCQYILQYVDRICTNDQWDSDWNSLHRLRRLRNTLIHEGGVGEETKLTDVVDRDDGFGAWVEPMFEGSDSSIFVLVVGEMHFMQWLQKLQSMVHDVDSEVYKSMIE